MDVVDIEAGWADIRRDLDAQTKTGDVLAFLVVYRTRPPAEQAFRMYKPGYRPHMRSLNEAGGGVPGTLHLRHNSALIPVSSLFHCIDRFAFRPGQVNRRGNVAMLHGYCLWSPRERQGEIWIGSGSAAKIVQFHHRVAQFPDFAVVLAADGLRFLGN